MVAEHAVGLEGSLEAVTVSTGANSVARIEIADCDGGFPFSPTFKSAGFS